MGAAVGAATGLPDGEEVGGETGEPVGGATGLTILAAIGVLVGDCEGFFLVDGTPAGRAVSVYVA